MISYVGWGLRASSAEEIHRLGSTDYPLYETAQLAGYFIGAV